MKLKVPDWLKKAWREKSWFVVGAGCIALVVLVAFLKGSF